MDVLKDSRSQPPTTMGLNTSEDKDWTRLHLTLMPSCVVNRILDFLSYEEVGNIRIICKWFNHIGQYRLNSGFRAVERYHANCIKEVKSKLPRRESVRRIHALARHSEILTAVETRLSLLSMTFMKFVDAELCCFIPGLVIDEIFRVLRQTRSNKSLPRAFDLLQELRDISSMAMEHFEEHIVPTFNLSSSTSFLSPKPSGSFLCSLTVPDLTSSLRTPSSTSSSVGKVSVIGDKILVTDKKFRALTNRNKKILAESRKLMQNIRSTIQEQNVKITNLEGLVSAQEAVIANQAELLKKQSTKMTNLEKHLNIEAMPSSLSGEVESFSGRKRPHPTDEEPLLSQKSADLESEAKVPKMLGL